MSRRAQFLLFVLVGIAATGAVLSLLWWLQDSVYHELIQRADPELTQFIRAFESAPITLLMLGLSKFGSWKGVLPATIVLCWVLSKRGRWRDAVGLGTAVVFGDAIQKLAKVWFARPRPEVDWALASERTYAFPSGHALMAVVFWGFVTYLVWHLLKPGPRRAIFVALVAAIGFLTGISRVYLGVHYPSDVFAGFIAGSVWFAAVLAGTRALHRPGDAVDRDA